MDKPRNNYANTGTKELAAHMGGSHMSLDDNKGFSKVSSPA